MVFKHYSNLTSSIQTAVKQRSKVCSKIVCTLFRFTCHFLISKPILTNLVSLERHLKAQYFAELKSWKKKKKMKKIEDEKNKLFIQKSYIFDLYIIGKLILWQFQKCIISMENIY